MILIDAMFINKGGGAVLLEYLIEKVLAHSRSGDFFFLLDPRFKVPSALQSNFAVVNNKLQDRYKFYKADKRRYEKVLCFANTPPPIRLKAKVYTYSHNQKLLDAPMMGLSRKNLSMYMKYMVIKLLNKNTDYYVVQTPHMVTALTATGLKDELHCLTIPFYDSKKYIGAGTPFSARVKDEFVFISNPSPQKNHPILLDAWEHLLDTGHTPVLHLTIDDTGPAVLERIKQLNERGARIVNHTYVDPRELYYTKPYLIFPSVTESFGLPLIEAADSGMKVLASDLPFVHDVVTPSLTFNERDKLSVAAAVLKALNTDLPFPKIVTRNEIDKLIALLAAHE